MTKATSWWRRTSMPMKRARRGFSRTGPQRVAERRVDDGVQGEHAQRHHRQREVVVGDRRLEQGGGQTSSRPSSPPVSAFHLKITVKTIWAKASESIAK